MSAICRICLATETEHCFTNIDTELTTNLTITQCIILCSSIQISGDDHLSQKICPNCLEKLRLFTQLRQLIIKSDIILRCTVNLQDNDNINIEKEFPISSKTHIENEELSLKTTKVSFKNTEETIKQYKCKECKKKFKILNCYNRHIKKHIEGKQFACEFCPKRFSHSYTLVYHSRIHSKEKPYTCNICSKSFRFPSNLYVHKRIHSHANKYKCDQCTESFHQLESLKIHMRKVHTGERPYMCEVCSNTFRSQSSLLTHQLDVHGQKKPCPVCKKCFSNRVLNRHMVKHIEQQSGVKKFNCEQCGKIFSSSSSKKKHSIIHTGEKPFMCEMCNKSFNQRSTLKTHMRVHSDFAAFTCQCCLKSFKYKHHLKFHLRNLHSETVIN